MGIPRWRKLLYGFIVLLAVYGAAEGLLAAAGYHPILYRDDPYVGFTSRVPLFVRETLPSGDRGWVTSPNKTGWFNVQRFAGSKPEKTFRIFCMGGSTTYGRPYDDATSFCGWLRELLPVADPSRRWELVNAGGISYASYRVAALMEELADHEPDLFIIYSGHNEALEHRTYQSLIETPAYITESSALLSHTRVFSAAREGLGALQAWGAAGDDAVATLPTEVKTLLDGSVGPEDYERDDAQRGREIEHYRFNLARMIEIGRAAGSQVLLVNPASNLKDCSPFKSDLSDGLSDFKRALFVELMGRAERAQRAGDPRAALGALEEAITIDARHAGAHYRRGQVLYALGRHEAAGSALRRAREEDICPLRATAAIGTVVREVAAQADVALVDFEALVEARAELGLPGASEFLDHVHLTIAGNRQLALDLIDALREMRILDPSSVLEASQVEEVAARVGAGLDTRAHGIALRNLAKVFSWAGKLAESERLALQASALLGGDGESHYLVGVAAEQRGAHDVAIAQYTRAIELEPAFAEAHNNLAGALLAEGLPEAAIEHYRVFLELRPESAIGHYNLGASLAAAGQPVAARDQYREALRLDPSLDLASVRLADVAGAPPGLRGAEASGERSAEALFREGNARLAEGQLDASIVAYRAALELRPESGPVHGNLAVALERAGRQREALPHFHYVVQLLPDDAGAQYNLGSALAAQGDRAGAEVAFEAAVRLSDDWDAPAESLAALRAGMPLPRQAPGREGARAVSVARPAGD